GYVPVERQRGRLAELGPAVLARTDHHRRGQKPARSPRRHGVDDDLQRRSLGDVAEALTIMEFGLDPEFSSFGIKVHGARRSHATFGVANRFVWKEGSRLQLGIVGLVPPGTKWRDQGLVTGPDELSRNPLGRNS